MPARPLSDPAAIMPVNLSPMQVCEDTGSAPCGVSGKHAGFIVNYGKAKASEIMSVFIKVQDEVKDKFGVDLEPEIQFIGDWSG